MIFNFFFFRIGQNQYFLCWEVSGSSEKLLNIKWWIGTKNKSWKKQKRSAIQRFWIWWSPWSKIARSEIRLFRILPKSGLATKLPKFELYRHVVTFFQTRYKIQQWSSLFIVAYRKVGNRITSCLVARIFRLLMKGNFDVYLLWPFGDKVHFSNSK